MDLPPRLQQGLWRPIGLLSIVRWKGMEAQSEDMKVSPLWVQGWTIDVVLPLTLNC